MSTKKVIRNINNRNIWDKVAICAILTDTSISTIRYWQQESRIPPLRYGDLLDVAEDYGIELSYQDLRDVRS